MRYLVGLDIGTSGTKGVLFDADGRAICSHTEDYSLYQPQNGWAEQNPVDWWHAVKACLLAITSKVDKNEIGGIGLSGQMHGLVMLDKEGSVLRDAILWCDGRTEPECREITQTVGQQRLIELTANPALPGFTASKILWVKKHEPEIYARCAHILLPKDYIRYMLTGEFATDVSDASGMQLLDVRHRCWSREMLQMLDIDEELLAGVYESTTVTGAVTEHVAAETGLAAGTPVAAGAGDNAAAAVGTGVVEDGKAFVTIGTSGVVYAHTSEMLLDPQGRIHTFCSAVPGEWHVMGVTQAAGLSLKWFRNNFCRAEAEAAAEMGEDVFALMDCEAEESPIGSNRLLYLPYLMGERTPHLDAAARGSFIGLSAMHQKRDFIRAIMEGVCFSLRDCMEILKEAGVNAASIAACGGGGSSPLWRKMLADIFGCSVTTVASAEGAALGAAILSGVAAGIYPSVQYACSNLIQTATRQQPTPEAVCAYEPFYQLYRGLYPALKDSFYQLSCME